jgi:phosphatidate cytidylyltransferase
MLRQRIITASILFALFLAALFLLPDVGWALVILLLVAQGASEWVRLAQMRGTIAHIFWWLTLASMAVLLWMNAQFDFFVSYPRLQAAVYIVAVVLWLAIAPLWMALRWQVRHPLALGLTGWAVLVPTGLALMNLRAYSPWMLLGLMALVWLADIAAYFAGRRYGKHKLAPSISPGKTWEGVVGALVVVATCSLAVWIFSGYVTRWPLFTLHVVVASCCWVALAVLGDLFESNLKRQAGLKDSGTLLPGHGGLLDRIDALTSTLPLAALALMAQMPT